MQNLIICKLVRATNKIKYTMTITANYFFNTKIFISFYHKHYFIYSLIGF